MAALRVVFRVPLGSRAAGEAAELVERIIAAVQLHARGVEQADDVTLLVIQRAANTAAA